MTEGLRTTVQESASKFTTSIPTALVKLGGMKKGDILIWNLDNGKIIIDVIKTIKEKT